MTDVVLETERLILRPMIAEDVEPLIQLMLDPKVAAHLTETGEPRDRSVEWRGAASLIGHWQIRGFGFFSVIEKETGAWVGRVGPWQPDGWPGLEVGWSIASDRWGRGYAVEAALATMRWTFDRFPDLSRLISVIEPANTNSQAVARRVGEVKTTERFDFLTFTLDIWAVDRATWFDRFADR
ncbi:MAG: GNAT family N-acetyltransferase [Pseudomonadota bacterium]